MKKETQQILSKISILVALTALVISLIALFSQPEVQGVGTDESLNQKFLEENSKEAKYLFILSDLISSPKKEVDSNQSPELKLVYDIIECESNWRPDVYGDKGKAYGLAQFHKPTFNWFCDLSGKKLNYYNPQHQIELLYWAIENDFGSHWTCYRKLTN